MAEGTETVTVSHLDADRFAIDVRGHRITVDQPSYAGGEDTAPTPTELFVASLASCVGFYARRYLARHDLSTEGLRVTSRFEIGGRPARVTTLTIDVDAPGLPPERREAFQAVISHCTVHNTLHEPPAVPITVCLAAAEVA
jgi:uncharacterized OsmC-like protein